MNLELYLANTPWLQEPLNICKSRQAEVDRGRREAHLPDTIHTTMLEGRAQALESVKKKSEQLLAKYNKAEEDAKTKYKINIENDKNRPFEISMFQTKMNALTDEEIKLMAVRYQRGERMDIFDPVCVDIMLSAIKAIDKNLFAQTRKAALEMDYERPYLRLISETDKQIKAIIDNGQFPVVSDRTAEGKGLEVIGISYDMITNQIR